MTALNEILRLCEELPVGSLSARKKETARVAREFQNPEYSEQILTDFRDEIKNGSPVSANYNPNGFYKIRLFKTGNTALRLHIDDPESDIPEGGRIEENKHDHRWSLYSVTLVGSIGHNIYGVSNIHGDSTEIVHQYAYSPRGGNDFFEMGYIGQVACKKTDNIITNPGDLTIMDAYKIHQAYYPEAQLTATMVITDEDRGRSNNYVFADDNIHCLIQQSGSTTPTPKIDRAQTLELVEKTISALRQRRAQQTEPERPKRVLQ